MTNPFYSHSSGAPSMNSRGASASMRSEFDTIVGGFDVVYNYSVDTGAANAMVITPPSAITSLTDGLRFCIKAANATTGATTVNMGSSLGTVALKRSDGTAISTDIKAGDIFRCSYSSTYSCLVLIGVTKNYVDQLAFSTALPAQIADGNSYIPKSLNGSTTWSQLKTIGGNALFGSGDIAVKTIGGNSIFGAGNIPNGIATVGATVTDNYTITTTTPTIWPVATTAIGKCLTAPAIDATVPLGLFAVIDNTAGGYPVGWRDSTGTLVGKYCVGAGGIAHVYLEANGTAAGTWRIEGTNLEPGLITIDNTFSSTYASTVLAPFVALDSNKSIHFAYNAAGSSLYAVAVDNITKTAGTPVLVDTATSTLRAAFAVSATTAIVFYTGPTGASNAVIVSLSGDTTLSVGISAAGGDNTYWINEDSVNVPKIAQLSPTLYVASTTASGTNVNVIAVAVSGTTVTIGAATLVTASGRSGSTTTYALTATTALVLYKSGAGVPYDNNAVVISVSGTTCTVGTPVAFPGLQSSAPQAPSSARLSATKVIVADDNNANATVVSGVTISGTTVTPWTANAVDTSASFNGLLLFTASSASRYNPHLWALGTNTAGLWYLDSSGISRAVVLTESGGTVTAGTKVYKSISSAASNSAGYGTILPQGTSEFVALREQLANSAGFGLQIAPSKINGTTITTGAGIALRDIYQDTPANYAVGKLSSGDYILLGIGSSGIGQARVPVFRTNGDNISMRGAVSIPELSIGSVIPVPNVASNRFFILGATASGTTVGATTYQLRGINLEIAQ